MPDNYDLSAEMRSLEEELLKEAPDISKFNAVYRRLNDTRLTFQKIVETVVSSNKSSKDFKKLHSAIAGQNRTLLVDRLRTSGYHLKKEKAIRETFERQGYRLLEQTRAGKRDDVYYGILRIFVSLQKEFPLELVEAFKPVYSDEMFKVFLFSFLSGVLGKESENE